jgi:hypothetical protein
VVAAARRERGPVIARVIVELTSPDNAADSGDIEM